VIGLVRWVVKLRRRSRWGHMRRSAEWQEHEPQVPASGRAVPGPAVS
jgi:hypothetical protein